MFSDFIIDFSLTRNELRYILDPKGIYSFDFPGETFHALKEKEDGRVWIPKHGVDYSGIIL